MNQTTGAAAQPKVEPVIFTKYFKTTFGVTFVAYFVAYLPFIVKMTEEKLQKNTTAIIAFAENVEELFVAGLAVSLAAFLTYYESEKEKLAGNNCANFAFANVVSVIICLLGFFLCRNTANHVQFTIETEPFLAALTMITNFLTLLFAFCTVLQVRRAKDGYV
jgi:hypothetical protein